ncbi:hypothetical protein F9B85_03935 [Heliorestis acidaminivorans]|uniref:Uncharacterized protein n=1 Tax=Heliorestis acidaminivorans TaxID=553427 RepID=A0A6I0F514_9FIRM|nr:hypothetical protein [Heliorestis acidaminivorans]KAB2953777.1 hypothetical protein F9B85_03935 [Heliorestis acidaminivorans]
MNRKTILITTIAALFVVALTATAVTLISLSDKDRQELLRGDPALLIVEKFIGQREITVEEIAFLLGIDLDADPELANLQAKRQGQEGTNDLNLYNINLNPLDPTALLSTDNKPEQLEEVDEATKVKIEYNRRLQNLQAEYENRLNNLLRAGQKEYTEAKAKNSSVQMARIATKYYSEGKALQKEADQRLNKLLREMERDFARHGISTELTQAVRTYYNRQVQIKQREIIQLALDNQ